MVKKEILVIECISSGEMYLEEIIERGYKVLLVNPICDDKNVMNHKILLSDKYSKLYGKDTFECFYCKNTPEDIFNCIKDHKDNIVCVVAGSEFGVQTTDNIAQMLGLFGNNPKTNYYRRTKAGMVESLNKAGIRAIKSIVVKSDQDIIDFYDSGITCGFIKFSEGAGSFGNKKCENQQEAIKHYHQIKKSGNYYGNSQVDILLQEYIDGDEYVVNTVSCFGKHVITDMWKYTKILNEEGNMICKSSTLIEQVGDKYKDLVDYAFKVLDAVDLKFGPCHAEYKIDKLGPVLVETNCRPMGGSTTRDYAKLTTGNCIVDWSLDALLDSENFLKKINPWTEYKTLKSAAKKYAIINNDVYGDIESGLVLSENLRTFHNHHDYFPVGMKKYQKTHDLAGAPLIVKFADDSYEDIKYDLELMKEIEYEYPEIFISPSPNLYQGDKIDTDAIKFTVENLLKKFGLNSALTYTDDKKYIFKYNKFHELNGQTDQKFDLVYYANTKAATLADKFREIFEMFSHLQEGGVAACDDCVIEMLPYKSKCFDILKKVARIN